MSSPTPPPARHVMDGLSACLIARLRPDMPPLPLQDERAMLAQHDADVAQLLPLLGTLFGMLVVLFGIWDALVDPIHSRLTLALRLLLVLAGAPAYWARRWNTELRCGWLYWTHAGAVILSCFLLRDGVLYGMAGVTACVFTAAVMTLRLGTLVLLFSLPFALYLLLGAWLLPWFAYLSGLMQYLLAMAVATVVMLTIRFFHQRAFVLEQELLHASRHDHLTGACNRRYLDDMAAREITLARRHQRPLAVAMLDIDHFKLVNDNYGHDIGDRVLQALVQTCHGTLRTIDHFGRTGGEEFVCILPETNEAEALGCAERLRLALAALRIDTGRGPLQFTVSIGVALLAADHADWDALLKDADTALYRAKNSGRNRVVLARHADVALIDAIPVGGN